MSTASPGVNIAGTVSVPRGMKSSTVPPLARYSGLGIAMGRATAANPYPPMIAAMLTPAPEDAA